MGSALETRTGDELRASRRRRMADDIELAALRLFAQHGVDQVTVDDIADAADISRRTFFRYFSSKDEIVLGDPRQQLEIVQTAALEGSDTETPVGLLRRILLALAAFSEHHREAVILRGRIIEKNPDAFTRGHGRQAALVEAVVEAMANHMDVDSNADIRPRVFVQSGFGAIHAAAQLWFAGGAKDSLEELATEALDLVLPR